VVKVKSFGSGVKLMGMPVVEVRPLCAIFHGLKASFVAVDLLVPCVCVVVVLVATAVAADLLSLSLVLVCARSCWVDIIVLFCLLCHCMVMSMLSTGACVAGCVFSFFCCLVVDFA